MQRVSVHRLGEVLLASIQQELTDSLAVALRQDLTGMAAAGTRGVIIDISQVEIVDSFLARVLAEIAAATRILAGRTVVCGMRPSVAITMVEMGLGLPGLHTTRSLEDALTLLEAGEVSL
ncbi:STAS domain-containing protein [Actinoallomurus rhizosphaericola]|uniref:STAS domain-containing protein n=1 Tax=Actinoallomurus rhizosphaericola TaxID=2952536 RepID=UPI002090A1AA|nr:STAS domain-containing protein [Actinoallomurus rhizosphaericola]MCO5993825.1 STAS domain-containing protein [Actinoallomurus rhizosphaericola]